MQTPKTKSPQALAGVAGSGNNSGRDKTSHPDGQTQSLEIERAIIVGAFRAPDRFGEFRALITEADYTDAACRTVWALMCEVHAGGLPPDITIILDLIKSRRLPGADELGQMVSHSAASPDNVAAYATMLRDRADQRRVVDILATAHADALTWSRPAHAVIADTAAKLETLQRTGARAAPFVIADVAAALHGGELPAQRFAIEQLVPLRQVTMLGGHGGLGKSALALVIAALHAACRKFAGLQTAGGLTVYVSIEDAATIVLGRLRRICDEFDLDRNLIERNLIVLDATEGDGALVAEFAEYGARQLIQTSIMTALRKQVVGAGLIVIDNASDAFNANENDRRAVRGFIRILTQLARDNDAGVLLLVHVDKHSAKNGAQGNTYSGSTAWHNSARSRLAMIADGDRIQLVQEKFNLGRKAEPINLRWSDHGVLVPTEGGGAGDTSTIDAHDDQAMIDALAAAMRDSVTVPAARTGPSTAQHVLQTYAALPKAMHGTRGRERFWNAMGRLIDTRRASSESYKNDSRKTKTRFVLTGYALVSVCSSSPIPPAQLEQRGCAPLRQSATVSTGAELERTGAGTTSADDYRSAHEGQ